MKVKVKGKRMKKVVSLVDKQKSYSLDEAVGILKQAHTVKFDESVDLAMKLGVDPRQSDQMVRGSVSLPHGLGKKVRVAVFCKGEETAAAKEAGADHVGDQDLIEKIKGGWLDFDVAVSTPDMMRELAKMGKILGPRGLMPSPKTGTVTTDVGRAVKEAKAGKVEFKMNKLGGIHVSVGKLSFKEEALIENSRSVIDALLRAKPQTAKGQYIESLYISSTMGPGVRINPSEYRSV